MAFPELVTPASPAATANTAVNFNFSNNGNAAVGPWTDGANRFLILLDQTNLFLRAYERVAGVWAEVDAANAPAIPTDGGGSPAPGIYEWYGVGQDTANHLLYVVLWDATFFIKVKKFNTSTAKWGAEFVSTLTYSFAALPGTSDNAGFGVMFRPADGILWVSWPGGVNGIGTMRVDGAKFDTTTTTWDAASIILGDTADDTSTSCCTGMAIDSGGNIHLIFFKRFVFPNITSQIRHQVIHPNNSLSAVQLVATTAVLPRFTSVTVPTISSRDILMVTAQVPTGGFFNCTTHVYRAQVPGDAPAWEDHQFAVGAGSGIISGNQGHWGNATMDVVFFVTSGGGQRTLNYVKSAGIGLPWDAAPTALGTTAGAVFIGTSNTANSIGAGFGVVLNAAPTGVENGTGYFEGVIAPPAGSTFVGTTGHWFADLESIWPLDEFGFGSPGRETIC